MKIKLNILLLLCLFAGICFQTSLNAEIVLKPDLSNKSIDYKNDQGKMIYGEIIDGKPEFVKTKRGNALALKGAELSYPASTLVNLNYGSISFDIKALSWKARRWRQGDARIIPLVYIGNENNFNRMQLFIASSSICFYSKYKNQQVRAVAEVPPESGLCAGKKWTSITITWMPQFINIYIDGKPVARASYGLSSDRQNSSSLLLRFMPLDNRINSGKKFATQIRNVKVMNSVLSAAEVKASFDASSQDAAKILTQSSAFIPNSQNAVVIDGKIDKAEWADATRLPLFKLNGKVRIDSNLPAWVYVKHDGKNLYLAYDIQKTEELLEPAPDDKFSKKVFDGNIVEFFCRRTEASLYQYRQFAVSPNNAYAARAENGKWEEFNFEHKTGKAGNSWFAEMAIPLRTIGLKTGQSFEANFGTLRAGCRSLGKADRWIVWSGTKYDSTFKNMGTLTLSAAPAYVRLKSIGDINYGDLDLGFESAVVSRPDIKLLDGQGKIIFSKSFAAGKSFKIKKHLKFTGSGFFLFTSREAKSGKTDYKYSSTFLVREPFTMHAVFDCKSQCFRLDLDLKGLRGELEKSIAAGKARLVLYFKSAADDKVYGKYEGPITKDILKTKLKCKAFPKGKYLLSANVYLDDKKYLQSLPFERPDDIFLRERKGLLDTIPQPWRALRWDGKTLKTAFHTYKFGDSPFPQSGSSRHLPVIESSEMLVASGAVKDHFHLVKEYELKKTGSEVISGGEMTAEKLKLKLAWRRTMAYDGLIRYDLALSPLDGPVNIDEFKIIFKLPYEVAKYAFDPHSTPSLCRNWTFRDKAEKRLFPSAWLSGFKAGLCVFTDNNANWVYPHGQLPLVIKKDKSGKSAQIVVNFISGKVKIKEKVPYVLGVMATPAKPPRKYWRQLHVIGAPKDEKQARSGRFINIRGWNYERKMFRWFRWILLTHLINPEAAKKRISYLKSKGIKSLPYACGALMPEKNSLYDFYGFSWRRSVNGRKMPKCEYMTGCDGVKFYGGVPVCANNPGYRDYMAYYTDKFLSDYDLVGIYLDFGGVYRSDKPYLDTDLKERLTPERPVTNFNTFGVRKLYERLRKVIQKRNPEYYLWIHEWDRYHPAVVSFADIIYPGEEFMHSIRKNLRAYIEETPLETWQAAYNSEIFGAAVQFLHQYRYYINPMHSKDKTNLEKIYFARDLMTLLLLHDITMSAAFVSDLRYQLDIADIKDAEFHPYYQQKEIESGDDMIKVSYYSWRNKPDRIIIVGNLGKKAVNVKLHFKNKNFCRLEMVDLLTGEKLNLNKSFKLGDYNFRVLKTVEAAK